MKAKVITIFRCLITLIVLSMAVYLVVVALVVFPKKMRVDFGRFETEQVDTVFMSMFPIDSYYEEDFLKWRGKNIIIAEYEIADAEKLGQYMNKLCETQEDLQEIYLGVRPDLLNSSQLLELIYSYPQYFFQVIISYPSVDYWKSLELAERQQMISLYEDCAMMLMDQENAYGYFFCGAEWLVGNSANYEDEFKTNVGVSQLIMLNCDEGHPYWINSSEDGWGLYSFEELILRLCEEEYTDLSGEQVVFFGDSIIGNYANTSSIPGVVEGVCGVASYNMGLGGMSAARIEEGMVSLPDVVEAFLKKEPELLPIGSQARAGLDEYITGRKDEPYCFVINCGLNDYFSGVPLSSAKSEGEHTFGGAMRESIQRLRANYPEARIIVVTPNFTAYFNNGEDYMSEAGGKLVDYVDELIAVAEEENVELIDNYHGLGITAENHKEFLSDGCHPNEMSRLRMGRVIAEQLGTQFQ